ncbi:DNA-binding response regulator [Amycolatopsis sp. WAC 01376]|uniref:response regulator n=1 Tax=Amycolatopsis sp. WAC 01376 TaxID=2203195 RepID=UPI000F77B529|nr:response regulator transcription factor [Amycolatopsis sp. WAC 01376]RSM56345.1 DNA-binding response regulator [Amycolatopsis sp. WAC 01376]
MNRVTTLVVDDQPLIRYALSRLLRDSAGVGAVAEAASEPEALSQCEKSHPDMVITELSIWGEPAGTAICRFVKEHFERAAVLVFAGDASPSAIAMALNAGADSFVHKSASGGQVMSAVRSTLAGQRVCVQAGETPRPVTEAVRYASLMTRREEDILALILYRWSNDEIAEELHLATQTVKNYVSRILQKLGFGSRRDLFRTLRFRPGGTPLPRLETTPHEGGLHAADRLAGYRG